MIIYLNALLQNSLYLYSLFSIIFNSIFSHIYLLILGDCFVYFSNIFLTAIEVGVNLKDGYNGDISAKDAGKIGGQMVKKMIEQAERNMK